MSAGTAKLLAKLRVTPFTFGLVPNHGVMDGAICEVDTAAVRAAMAAAANPIGAEAEDVEEDEEDEEIEEELAEVNGLFEAEGDNGW